ncbi:hypothetical protein [Vibrio sp. 10N.239.312.D08]|uniref:hypothetical protein n=1 Tax=Vibrio sp. 10N.239.312.D08 TaxID=3229978 RepID=UPI00354DA732
MEYWFFGSMLLLSAFIGVVVDLRLFKWHKEVDEKTLIQSIILEASKSPLGIGLALLFIEIALSLSGYQFDGDFKLVADLCFMFGYYFIVLSLCSTALAMVLRHYNYFQMKDQN